MSPLISVLSLVLSAPGDDKKSSIVALSFFAPPLLGVLLSVLLYPVWSLWSLSLLFTTSIIACCLLAKTQYQLNDVVVAVMCPVGIVVMTLLMPLSPFWAHVGLGMLTWAAGFLALLLTHVYWTRPR